MTLKPSFKSAVFQSRIKRIMQSDEDVGKVAAASTVLVARALESFLNMLMDGSIEIASSRDAHSLTSSHLKACVAANPLLDFCKDATAAAPDLPAPGTEVPEAPRRAKRSRAASGETTSVRSSRKQAGGRGQRTSSKAGTIENQRSEAPGAEASLVEPMAETVEVLDAATRCASREAHQDQVEGLQEEGAQVILPATFFYAAPGKEAEEEDYD